MSDKSLIELMDDMKRLADQVIAKGEGVIGCVTEERIDPEPAPDKPVDWQVIIDEGLLCDFDGFIGQLQDVHNDGHDRFRRLGGAINWRECTPLPHQSVNVPVEVDAFLERKELNHRLSEAGFENQIAESECIGMDRYLVVCITGPRDGYTYEAQS